MIIPSLGGKTSPETSQPQRLRRGQEKRTFLGPKSEKKIQENTRNGTKRGARRKIRRKLFENM